MGHIAWLSVGKAGGVDEGVSQNPWGGACRSASSQTASSATSDALSCSPRESRRSWAIEGSNGLRTPGLSALASTLARMLLGESVGSSARLSASGLLGRLLWGERTTTEASWSCMATADLRMLMGERSGGLEGDSSMRRLTYAGSSQFMGLRGKLSLESLASLASARDASRSRDRSSKKTGAAPGKAEADGSMFCGGRLDGAEAERRVQVSSILPRLRGQ